jgi:hypothetical protein
MIPIKWLKKYSYYIIAGSKSRAGQLSETEDHPLHLQTEATSSFFKFNRGL